MNNYVPFLKLKQNEIGALSTLSDELKDVVVPFFDFPRKNDMTELSFVAMVQKAVRSVSRHLSGFDALYLDNYDIDDGILVGGTDNYQFIIESFAEINFIPVVGLDRTHARNKVVFGAKKDGKIQSDKIAIRLQYDDFEDYELVQDDIQSLIDAGDGLFSSWILIMDNRMCLTTDVATRSADIVRFISECFVNHDFDQIIITGSSIPASIGDIVQTESEVLHTRKELLIYRSVSQHPDTDAEFLTIGDYTIVSPLYSDISIPVEAMRNVTAPKLTYSYDSNHLILRGGALTSHPRGSLQYNDMAQNLIALPLYRGEPYSFGDKYIYEKANFGGASVTPSSILKPTINAHITYMCQDFTI